MRMRPEGDTVTQAASGVIQREPDDVDVEVDVDVDADADAERREAMRQVSGSGRDRVMLV